MKSLLTFLTAFLLSSITAFSQAYNPFTPGGNRYFMNAQGYVRGMRIDSVSSIGNSLIYHPYRSPRGEYGIAFIVSTPLDPNGASWLGKNVIKRPDGTFLFDNFSGDTVVIRTQCEVGDSWVFRAYASSQGYIATCVSKDTMTILGTLDSVKTVRITTTNTNDPVNNFEFVLSKQHGFYKVFDLYTFPYPVPDINEGTYPDIFMDICTGGQASAANSIFTLTDFHIPSYAELHDWQPGDKFFYTGNLEWTSPFKYTSDLDSITGKTIGSGGVVYYFMRKRWVNFGGEVTFSTFFDSVFFSSEPLLERMPEETDVFEGTKLITYKKVNTSYCSGSGFYETKDLDFSFTQPTWIVATPFNEYKAGIGFVHYYNGPWANIDDRDKRLVYYKMDNTECGLSEMNTTLYYLSTTNLLAADQEIKIFPNPARDFITIEAPYAKCKLHIFNSIGQVVKSEWLTDIRATIHVQNLVNGMYYIKLEDEAGNFLSKTMVIQD
ncbi:MAG TPA: T9SS type A sorting domain-containing protein [Flavipsychrobacter sp.]|nr:T9SS type A sorting domain-containing protein [Flavipsychrobacter sp.]